MTALTLHAVFSNRRGHFASPKGLHAGTRGIERLALWLLLGVTTLDVCAQTASTGALTGTVTDPTGAVIRNAKITLRNYGTRGTLTASHRPGRIVPFFPAARGRV